MSGLMQSAFQNFLARKDRTVSQPDRHTESLPAQRNFGSNIALCLVTMTALCMLRTKYEIFTATAIECIAVGATVLVAMNIRRTAIRWSIALGGLGLGMTASRIAVAVAGCSYSWELAFVNGLGWLALLVVLLSHRSVHQNAAVALSGFLIAFAAVIADDHSLMLMLAGWWCIFFWELTTKHWRAADVLVGQEASRPKVLQVSSYLFGLAIFAALAVMGGYLGPRSSMLGLNWLPTSGGESYGSAHAMKGLGKGELLVAATKQASSFGNVQSDIFIDSKDPSLYDLYSEQFGKPRKRKNLDRTQALSSEKVREQDGKLAESKTAGESFSIDRDRAAQKMQLASLDHPAMMFWSGRGNIRLAVARYEEFSGTEWSNRSSVVDEAINPATVLRQDATWFKAIVTPSVAREQICVDEHAESLKFNKYRSAVIPTTASLDAWHIDQIDRADFFCCDGNQCLHMVDRQHVPDYTAIQFINHGFSSASLTKLVRPVDVRHDKNDDPDSREDSSWQFILDNVEAVRADSNQSLPNVAVAHKPVVESSSLNPANTSDKPSYQYATAAALRLRELGYRTRFAVGFFVPERIFGMRHTDFPLTQSSLHTWVEVCVSDDCWVPLESCPGYPLPSYQTSLMYKFKRVLGDVGLPISAVSIVMVLVVRGRRALREWSWVAYWYVVGIFLNSRQQLALFERVMDLRLERAGAKRPMHVPLNRWLAKIVSSQLQETMHLASTLSDFDRLSFGPTNHALPHPRTQLNKLIRKLRMRILRVSVGSSTNQSLPT